MAKNKALIVTSKIRLDAMLSGTFSRLKVEYALKSVVSVSTKPLAAPCGKANWIASLGRSKLRAEAN